MGIRQRGEQRGLARVRQADQPQVRDQLQFQFEAPLFVRFPFFGHARRLVARRRKMLVAASAAPALANGQPLAGLGQVAQ